MSNERETVASNVCVVGLGGAGCKILDAAAAGCGGPIFVAVNTDSGSLRECRATTKVQIGSARAKGRGTGGDAEAGRRSAQDDMEMLKSLFSDTQIVVVVVGLGGGTGTGAAPVLLSAAREMGATTICFAALPFKFEGEGRTERADRAVAEMRGIADALVVLPNDRLFEAVSGMNLQDAFAGADRDLGAAISAIWKLVTRPGYISLGLPEIRTVLRHGAGPCFMVFGEGRGADKAGATAAALMACPLAECDALGGAGCLLVSIVGGPDLALKEVGEIMGVISGKAPKDARVFMGTVLDEEHAGRISVSVIGFEKWSPDIETKQGSSTAPVEDAAAGLQAAHKRVKQIQTNLELDVKKGRFEGVEPTVVDGEDADVPTYVRRGIQIER